jgi:hypothetical protein
VSRAGKLVVVPAAVLGLLAVAFVGSVALDRPATRVHEEMVVSAPRELVWRLLTDFDRYETWNPYITRASGEARKGEQIVMRLEPRHHGPQEVECDVLEVKQLRKVFWRCRDYLPGLLDREHTFRLLPLGDDRIRLVYEGRWEGIFVPFADLDDRKTGYRRMAQALKDRAERGDP